MVLRSHGDGRRMTVAEAVERRARMIRVHGGLERAFDHAGQAAVAQLGCGVYKTTDARAWAGWQCSSWACFEPADGADDVSPDDRGVLVPMCARCRGAR